MEQVSGSFGLPHIPIPRNLCPWVIACGRSWTVRDEVVLRMQPSSLTSSTGRRGKDPLSQPSEDISSKHRVQIAEPQLVADLLTGMKTNS